MRKRLFAWLSAGLIAAAGAYSVWAAEEENSTEDDVFVPTEEISEDFPAPFPVDI